MAIKSCCNNITDDCPQGKPNASCVIYTGGNLPCLGATTNMRLDEILGLIEELACESGLNLTYNNWLNRNQNVVQFGGTLVNNTTIDFVSYEVAVDNLGQDDTSPFLMSIDNNGIWKKVASTTFATSTEGQTLPSTVAENGLNYSFDLPSKQYTIHLGGPLIEDTNIDFDVFNLSLTNVPSGSAISLLSLDVDGNIITTDFASILSFQNALTLTGSVVEWGGTLLHDTTVTQGGFSTNFVNNSLTQTNGFNITSVSTGAAINNQRLLNVSLSGANATSNQITRAATVLNTHTGTGSQNIGIYASASGAATNYSIFIPYDGISGVARLQNVNVGDNSNVPTIIGDTSLYVGATTSYVYIRGNTSSPTSDSVVAKSRFRVASISSDVDGLVLTWSSINTVASVSSDVLTIGANDIVSQYFDNAGHIGFRKAIPTAGVHIGAGSNVLAPLKIDNGTILTTPQNNSIENDGTDLYYTDNSGTRFKLNKTPA